VSDPASVGGEDPSPEEIEEVDGLPVLLDRREPVPVVTRPGELVLASRGAAPALVAVSGFLAGVLAVALMRRRRDRAPLMRSAGRRLGRRAGRRGAPARLLRIADSRSILLDIHLIDRD
jgi:hypothetical protein